MRSVVVLQARTSSSRLPGKVLLPVSGIPLVVLAAKRASNSGRSVIVATSSEPDDDGLADILAKNAISCFRGSLMDTLSRMVAAVAGYSDDTLFVRLTADNAFPDGQLIDEVEEQLVSRSLEYIACGGDGSGLPYGVSVEITRVGHLREALRNSSSEYDREHVTPYLIRKFGRSSFTKYAHLRKEHFRCTVDVYEDYINVNRVFSGTTHPITASVLELIERLGDSALQPVDGNPVPSLIVGAAQLGFDYGITNFVGRPSATDAERMLKIAISNGVKFIDTARAYGSSEEIVGASLAGGWSSRAMIITKLSPLNDCPPDAPDDLLRAKVDASVFESCMRLRRSALDVLMLHRAEHAFTHDGVVLEHLRDFLRSGLVRHLGVSVQGPKELEAVLDLDDIDYVQLPFNALDYRWDDLADRLEMVRSTRGLIVHARSALLQGLLISEDLELWHRAHVSTPQIIWRWLRRCTEATVSSNPVEFCLRYVRSQPWIDGVVVGMETIEQVLDNIHHFNQPEIPADEVRSIRASRPYVGEITLDPSKWVPVA